MFNPFYEQKRLVCIFEIIEIQEIISNQQF